ncbi:hypothetical protein EJ03DRAFT_178704 [Teratosphaeria nubilosa]|uniref:Zn(2)-C6 fungal-type domain-containing protein n=1 Tax=Teratosphaeria nubilosa TaxID=161662 RepID=A0A6G1L0D7_9PEZI|nr:hypothetical protein EJ03DRAFT_178704 [Teratosphaeria nubilosa]
MCSSAIKQWEQDTKPRDRSQMIDQLLHAYPEPQLDTGEGRNHTWQDDYEEASKHQVVDQSTNSTFAGVVCPWCDKGQGWLVPCFCGGFRLIWQREQWQAKASRSAPVSATVPTPKPDLTLWRVQRPQQPAAATTSRSSGSRAGVPQPTPGRAGFTAASQNIRSDAGTNMMEVDQKFQAGPSTSKAPSAPRTRPYEPDLFGVRGTFRRPADCKSCVDARRPCDRKYPCGRCAAFGQKCKDAQ